MAHIISEEALRVLGNTCEHTVEYADRHGNSGACDDCKEMVELKRIGYFVQEIRKQTKDCPLGRMQIRGGFFLGFGSVSSEPYQVPKYTEAEIESSVISKFGKELFRKWKSDLLTT